MAADVLTTFIESLGVSLANPVTLAINILLSTLIGGIVLLIIVKVIGMKFSEKVNSMNAFLAVLVINLINFLGLLGLITPFISFIPFLPMILPVIVWIVLMKAFFNDMSLPHAAIVGIIGYVVSIYVIPYLVGIASGFIPSFV